MYIFKPIRDCSARSFKTVLLETDNFKKIKLLWLEILLESIE